VLFGGLFRRPWLFELEAGEFPSAATAKTQGFGHADTQGIEGFG
jgi:hypothetical protein